MGTAEFFRKHRQNRMSAKADAQKTTHKLTMHDVARAAGVSPMTVSNAFRYPERVQARTREAVLNVAAELGYVPNLSAGLLAAGQSRVIGAVLPSIRNSSFYHYTMGLKSAAAERGLEVITMIAETPQEEMRAVQTLLGLRVAGLVLVAGAHVAALRGLVEKSGVAVVESWAPPGESIGQGVGYDVGAASAELTRHVIASGRRRIGFVNFSGGTAQRYSLRLPAYSREMFVAGLRDDCVLDIREADGFGAGAQIVDALLGMDRRIEAILCPTDVVAAGAIFECTRRGLKVPEDIAIAGWGDYDIGRQISPRLTTIAPFSNEIGKNAVELLLTDSEEVAVPDLARTRFQLLVRDSA